MLTVAERLEAVALRRAAGGEAEGLTAHHLPPCSATRPWAGHELTSVQPSASW